MKYHYIVNRIFELINNAFVRAGEKIISQNLSFAINKERDFHNYVEYIRLGDSHCTIIFEVSDTGLCIQIDRISKCFEFPADTLEEEAMVLEKTIGEILTSAIQIKYYGDRITEVTFHHNSALPARTIRNLEPAVDQSVTYDWTSAPIIPW